jgi:hypothetical protein
MSGSPNKGGGAPSAPPTAAAAANAFDFDVDFDKVQKRRAQYLAKKAAEKGDTLLQGVDAQDGTANGHDGQLDDGTDGHQQHNNANPANQIGFARGLKWLRGNAGATSGVPLGPDGQPLEDGKEPEEILFGGKRVTQWPYDEFHLVQQGYYVKLEELEDQANHGESKEDQAAAAAAASRNTNLQRPADPPDIPTAVRSLPLNNFEQKAEERAIAIVSTWLFDCGLIDELLVHGGMGKSTMSGNTYNNNNNNGNSDGASVPSSEGIEIGTSGFPIEGPSKMDKELSKLKATSQRTLALINARLNDGVAASGGEVQELVNAVNSTKDDLGRLRELSTYISNTGDVERSQKFMLTRYPKLKKAINARRNLARCFRELDFYSQIPVTCDRLREELHSAEWTENEWSSLREVSREHVELEIFLVEAEAGMKKRIDEELHENNPEQRRTTINMERNRSSYVPKGMPHNYEEVDNFLHEHVKNVWELGDEIRLRIMSGIGSAFELAMNNPAGMVALVEAVEVYETANEEYRAVHGEEAGRNNQTLRFTDMRASALKQIYQDFELRGLEVFNEVVSVFIYYHLHIYVNIYIYKIWSPNDFQRVLQCCTQVKF